MTAPSSLPIGPYCNEDGDWWVPVAAEPNRMKAAHVVRKCVDDDRLKVVYLGRSTTRLTPHEYGCACDPDCHQTVAAWHFEERDR